MGEGEKGSPPAPPLRPGEWRFAGRGDTVAAARPPLPLRPSYVPLLIPLVHIHQPGSPPRPTVGRQWASLTRR